MFLHIYLGQTEKNSSEEKFNFCWYVDFYLSRHLSEVAEIKTKWAIALFKKAII